MGKSDYITKFEHWDNQTPLQKLIQYESDLTNMFDSDAVVAGALLKYIRTNKKDFIREEKEFIENVFEDAREEEYQFHVNGLKQDTFEKYYNNKYGKK